MIKQTLKKIKGKLIKPNKTYLDLTLYNRSYKKGLRLVKIPLNKYAVIIASLIFIIAIITPFTNWVLFPVGFWVLKKWG